MTTITERQKYASQNIHQAIALEAKVKNNKRSRFLKGHSASLALAIRLGFETTVQAQDAGYENELKKAFEGAI